MTPTLRVEGLSKSFVLRNIGGREVTALRDVNLEVCAGEFVALGGPSGGGKSSLLKCVYRTYRPTAGRVTLTRIAVCNARAVLPDRILEDATVVCEGGLIAEVASGLTPPEGAIDARGAYLLPALVDPHSDALEKEINPRPGSEFPPDFAVRSLEGRLVAAGIGTTFTGIGFQDNPGTGRSIPLARQLCAMLDERSHSGQSPVDHRILYRLDARTPDGLEALLECLPSGEQAVVSIEDHTPGQGQFRDMDVMRRQYRALGRASTEEEVEALLRRRIAERDVLLPHAARNRAALADLVRTGRIRLLAHDVEDQPQMLDAFELGATVAEFPLSREATTAARDLGMSVVMGAPNLVRGGSLAGSVNAGELIQAGLCDALASDYQPSTLLAATFLAAEQGLAPLPQTIALVTLGPARLAGMTDRGSLGPGQRASMILVTQEGGWSILRKWITEDSHPS